VSDRSAGLGTRIATWFRAEPTGRVTNPPDAGLAEKRFPRAGTRGTRFVGVRVPI